MYGFFLLLFLSFPAFLFISLLEHIHTIHLHAISGSHFPPIKTFLPFLRLLCVHMYKSIYVRVFQVFFLLWPFASHYFRFYLIRKSSDGATREMNFEFNFTLMYEQENPENLLHKTLDFHFPSFHPAAT